MEIEEEKIDTLDELGCIPRDTSTFGILEYIIIGLILQQKLTNLPMQNNSCNMIYQTLSYIPINIRGIAQNYYQENVIKIFEEEFKKQFEPSNLKSIFDYNKKK